MNLPIETKPALWGAAGGAIALAIVGFTWGGWVTGGRADTDATQRADTAVIAALAPICVAKFQSAPDVSGNLAALKKAETWTQGDFIEKGGWASAAGSSKERVSAVARVCASSLAAA
jgi:hypothetical protein